MKYKKDSLGDRMKGYENISRIYLTKRMPVIIRIDGKAFHSFTRGFQRPFDSVLIQTMQQTAQFLCENIMCCKLAYTQSDEISLLLVDYEKNETQPWFENNLQKIVSIASSMATMAFNRLFYVNATNFKDKINSVRIGDKDYPMGFDRAKVDAYIASLDKAISRGAMFDARAFILPKEEVCNYFIWRQQDAVRNSIQMVAQSLFSEKQLHKKNCNELQEMMFQEKGINWNNFSVVQKQGSCCVKIQYQLENTTRSKWTVDTKIPVFTKDRDYIDRRVFVNV